MLELTGVKKGFVQANGEQTQILDVPKYVVEAGEQAILIGPSGGGKTTLLHIIAGITSPDSGKVVVDGLEITGFQESVRDRIRAAKIGYVFQTFNLLSGFTALENVILGMTFGRGKKDLSRAKMLLEKVGLSHRLNSKPRTMSVGEQQRVAVARALANRPKLLLADEPTANVDPANQQAVIDLIRQFCESENIAMVMVTHSMDVSSQFDRVDPLDSINLIMSKAKADA